MPAIKIIDHVREEHCIPELQGGSREEVIEELAETFVTSGQITDDERAVLLETVMEREAAASTGIAKGVALPHPKDPHDVADYLTDVLIAVGLHRAGVDFAAPDGEAVHIVFLVASPDKHEYLEVAKRVVVLAMGGSHSDKWRRVMRGCRTPKAIREVLDEAWEEMAP